MRPLVLLAALSALLSNSCYSAGDGKPPPLDELYFPTGLALDRASMSDPDGETPRAPKYMYVVNSDFDLQYRAASLISYNLDVLHRLVPRSCNASADCQNGDICDAPGVEGIPTDPTRVPSYYCVNPITTLPCGAVGERDEADRVLNPGRCDSINPNGAIDPIDPERKLVVSSVGIGAFATDVIWRPADPRATSQFPGRLFVPVRGDSTLHWIDVTEAGTFQCGQVEGVNDNGCDPEHRSGDVTSDNFDQLRQPSEPFAVDATANGEFVAITNQTSGSVSLFANDWARTGGPKLVSILTGLPLAPVGIAALPEPEFAQEGTQHTPGFLITYRSAAQIDLLRVRDDEADSNNSGAANYTRYALTRAGSVPITANSLGFDSRGIAIDDSQRKLDYQACRTSTECDAVADPLQCRADCLRSVHQPSVYVASRAPASLLVGAMTNDLSLSGTSELPSFSDSISLTFGPSRVVVGDVKVPGTSQSFQDSRGFYELERRVFVVCFDSRRIFVYDPKRRVIDAIVSTGRGPFALALDGERGLAYVGHFTDSYLGVISLDQRFPKTYATIVASVGVPKSPRSSK
ncbi:MAG TPA: hypothetical protein VJV79_33555 [Polyangiaceae bacterium]|nr:hypothetical protein [Polyangiaceae bacterium]